MRWACIAGMHMYASCLHDDTSACACAAAEESPHAPMRQPHLPLGWHAHGDFRSCNAHL